jgi:hypothetical protein
MSPGRHTGMGDHDGRAVCGSLRPHMEGVNSIFGATPKEAPMLRLFVVDRPGRSRIGSLSGVVADVILEDDFDLLDVLNLLRRITVKDDDIGRCSRRNRPNRCVFAQEY